MIETCDHLSSQLRCVAQMNHMLTRWCEDAGLEVPDVHSRKLDESIKTLAAMVIDGKDWPLEDCLADGDNFGMRGPASQSILKGYNPFSSKDPVKICENIEDEYGPPGVFVFQPGDPSLEVRYTCVQGHAC